MTYRNLLHQAFFNGNGIARRLIVALVLFSSAITAIITAIQLYRDYRSDLNKISESFDFVRVSAAPALIGSIWVSDSPQINTQLEGLLRLRDIEFIGVYVDGRLRWSAGGQASSRILSDRMALIRPYRGQQVHIGELRTVASLDNVWARLLDRLVLVLIENGVKTFLVAAFMLLVFQLLVTRHLSKLSGYAQTLSPERLGADDLRLDRPDAGRWRPDALDRVVQSINDLRRKLHAAYRHATDASEALRKLSERLTDAQQLAKVGSWELDLTSGELHWSPEIYRIFEIDPNKFGASYDAFLDAIHPEDREAVNQAYTGSLADRAPYQITHRLKMPDGRIKHVQERCESEFDAAGKPLRSVGTVQDVTAEHLAEQRLRAALREKEVLLKEVYHRVKNNLQVVASLLNLQGRGVVDTGTKDLLAESANRVKSMALVHEQLYRSQDLSNIGLGEYLEQLAEHLRSVHWPLSGRVRLRLEVADMKLGLETAVPLGLIVNELVSNAYKHGYAADAPRGEIVLGAQVQEGGAVRLEVSDDGRGLPEGFDIRTTTSLGMQLAVTLSEQLGGALSHRTASGGASFQLVFRPEAGDTQRRLA